MHRLSAVWSKDLQFTIRGEADGEIAMSGDEGVAGHRPMRLLLASLLSCTAMDVIAILGKKRQPIGGYEIDGEGEQREGHPRTFTSIVIEHRFAGEGGAALDPAAIHRAIELSATRYCPVTAQIATGETRISHRYRIIEPGPDGAGSPDTSTDAIEVVVTGPFGAGLAPRA